MGVVERAVAAAVGFTLVVGVQGGVDGAAEGGLGLEVGGGDLDFLEAEYVGPFPSLEVCPE